MEEYHQNNRLTHVTFFLHNHHNKCGLLTLTSFNQNLLKTLQAPGLPLLWEIFILKYLLRLLIFFFFFFKDTYIGADETESNKYKEQAASVSQSKYN